MEIIVTKETFIEKIAEHLGYDCIIYFPDLCILLNSTNYSYQLEPIFTNDYHKLYYFWADRYQFEIKYIVGLNLNNTIEYTLESVSFNERI